MRQRSSGLLVVGHYYGGSYPGPASQQVSSGHIVYPLLWACAEATHAHTSMDPGIYKSPERVFWRGMKGQCPLEKFKAW